MADVYKIGVSIVLANGMSPVLGIIAKDLLGIKTKMKDVEGGASRWRLAVAGVAAIMGSGAILGAYAKLVEKGSELVHQQEVMKTSGMSQLEVAKATAAAWKLTAQYRNVGVTDVMKIIGETRLPYGSTDRAIQNAGSAVALTSIIRSTLGKEKGDRAAEDMFEVVRSAEMRNISMDPAKMATYFDDVAKVLQAFHGKVAAKDFFQFEKYARTNTPYLSERFLTKIAPSLMLEMGSSSGGTALTSLSQAVIAGKMTKRAAEEMIKLGLIAPSSVLKTTSTSTQLKAGAVSGWQLAVSDPDLWVQQYLMPAMQKHGITGDMAQRLTFGMVFGNRTAENLANVLGKPESVARLNKDAAMIAQATGLRGAKGLQANDPTTAFQSLTTAWNNFLTAAGAPLVPVAVRFMNTLTGVLEKLTAAAASHPGAVKIIGEVALGLAGALAVIGTFAIGAAAIAAIGAAGVPALIGGAIAAVVGFVTTIAALNWDKVTKFFAWAGDMLGKFFKWFFSPVGGGQTPNTPWSNTAPLKPNIPPPQNQGHKTPAAFIVDGRKLGEVIWGHASDVANRPVNGMTSFDGRQHMTPVAMTTA